MQRCPGFSDIPDRESCKHGSGDAPSPLCLFLMLQSLGGRLPGASGGRLGLGDKINAPFVLLGTPAGGETMPFLFFFENGNCQYAVSITHLVYSFFCGF